jgi:hypothetical protein
MKAAFLCGREHGTEVDILGQTTDGLVVEAIVAWDGVCAMTPQQRDQVDARDNTMVFARPVPMDQFNVLSIGFVERGVIDNQEASVQRDMPLSLVPERCGVRVKAMEQAGQDVMGSTAWRVWLDARGFGTGEDQRGSNQRVDSIEVSDFGSVHFSTIPHIALTA